MVVVGALVWGWYLTLFLAFIMTVLPYAVLRAIRNLEQRTIWLVVFIGNCDRGIGMPWRDHWTVGSYQTEHEG